MGRRKKRPAGQPPKWESVDKLQASIDEYYDKCNAENRPMTIAGLGVHLGVSRQTIYNYSYTDKFFDTIEKARDKILAYYEEQAIVRGNAGTIFLMKNYGYRDRQEIEVDAKAEAIDAIKSLGDKFDSD